MASFTTCEKQKGPSERDRGWFSESMYIEQTAYENFNIRDKEWKLEKNISWELMCGRNKGF